MKPLKITLSAFGPYAKKQVIDFSKLGDRSLFLIHGRTGSGKTTILDAISYALYGVSSGDRKGRQMRSDHALSSAMTEVTFDFSLGAKRYRVTRRPEQERQKKRGEGTTLERNAATLFEMNPDGTEKAILGDQWTKVTEKIEELFGFKADQFRQVVLLPQGSFRRLLLAPSKDREQILQSLFHTHIYRSLEEHLKQQAKELKDELESFKQQKSEILHARNVESLEELRSKLTEEKRQLKRSDEQLKILRGKTVQWQETLEKARVELRAWEDHRESKTQLDALLEKKPAFDLSRTRLANAAKANPLRAQYHFLVKLEMASISFEKEYQEIIRKLNEKKQIIGLQVKVNPYIEAVKVKGEELFAVQSLLSRAEDLELQRLKLTDLENEQRILTNALSEKKCARQKIDQALLELSLSRSSREEIEGQLQDAFGEKQRLQNILGKLRERESLQELIVIETTKFRAVEAEFNDFLNSLQFLREDWLGQQCPIRLNKLIEKEREWSSRYRNLLVKERSLMRLQLQEELWPSIGSHTTVNRESVLCDIEGVEERLKCLRIKLSKAPGDLDQRENNLQEQQNKLQI
ncbi:MAG: AAA family ATPase, partial [Planctomycetota bacterium]|nr:AAA family ATPase [Planctomycetota bacterium]